MHTKQRSEERNGWMYLPGIRNDLEEGEVSEVELFIENTQETNKYTHKPESKRPGPQPQPSYHVGRWDDNMIFHMNAYQRL